MEGVAGYQLPPTFQMGGEERAAAVLSPVCPPPPSRPELPITASPALRSLPGTWNRKMPCFSLPRPASDSCIHLWRDTDDSLNKKLQQNLNMVWSQLCRSEAGMSQILLPLSWTTPAAQALPSSWASHLLRPTQRECCCSLCAAPRRLASPACTRTLPRAASSPVLFGRLLACWVQPSTCGLPLSTGKCIQGASEGYLAAVLMEKKNMSLVFKNSRGRNQLWKSPVLVRLTSRRLEPLWGQRWGDARLECAGLTSGRPGALTSRTLSRRHSLSPCPGFTVLHPPSSPRGCAPSGRDLSFHSPQPLCAAPAWPSPACPLRLCSVLGLGCPGW
nr:uncharacterized protein LOC123286430 [Equus asinus]